MTTEDVLYKINVKTGLSGIDANVILCIFGDENSSPNLPLRQVKSGADAKFDEKSSLEFDVKTTDVGKIKKINIGHDGKGADHQWFLESITIDKGDEHYQFDANRWLAEEKDDKKTYVDLLPIERSSPTPTTTPGREQTSYHITVVTKSDENAGTDSGVLMTIFGDQDATKQFQLTQTKQGDAAKFSEGTTNEFEMNLVDVGQITKINIGQDGNGTHPKWTLETVQIKKGTQNYNFYANQTLDETNAFVSLTPSSGALAAKKTSSPDQTKMSSSRSGTPRNATPQTGASRNATPQPKVTKKEVSYKVSIQPSSEQEEAIDDDSSFYLILHGQDETSPKFLLKDGLITDKKHALKKDSKIEFEFKCLDLGKVKKLVLGQEEGTKWHVEFVTVKHNFETTTFNAEKIIEPHSSIELVPSAIPKKNESTYKIILRTATQQGETGENHLTLTIVGTNGQTKKMPLNETTKTNKKAKIKREETIEFDVKGNDVGRITKIILENDGDDQSLVWHIHHITIKRGILTTTFNVSRKLDPRTPLEFQPSPLPAKSETPRPQVKTPDTAPPLVTETKDSDYEITITTGVQALQASANLKIRGEKGIVTIPLTKTTSGNEPFQANATDTFVCQTTDVGRIRRITLENTETNPEKIWHVQTVEIKKDNEILQFVGDVRLDWKSRHANLYPVGALHGQLKEDYVQTELRRLRENLRTESSKLRAPPHKAHEPFLYNDLSPYFDTSAVERAIYLPLEAPLTYHTRITALRVVEPWEAHAMDYGVSYELMKSRKGRSFSAKRPNAGSNDVSIDRKQGSTHLPKFPCVDMKKPREYARTFTVNDVPKIRSLIRNRYTAQAQGQIDKDYKRTREDIYRMQLDDMKSYHQSNRDNMVQIYHSYLENTPGSKKALQELCDQLPSTEMKNDTA